MSSFILLFLASVTTAAVDPPTVGVLYSQESLRRATFRCDAPQPEAPYITCRFDELRLLPPDQGEAARKVHEVDGNFENYWKDRVTSKRATLSSVLGGCPGEKAEQAAERQRISKNKHASLLLPPSEQMAPYVARLCACTTMACAHDATKEMMLADARADAEACTIWPTAHWAIDFVQAGSDWVSTDSSPTGCHASITTTLSKAKDGLGSFWNMRIVRVPRPGADPKYCSTEIEDNQYSWRSYGLIKLNCKTLKL